MCPLDQRVLRPPSLSWALGQVGTAVLQAGFPPPAPSPPWAFGFQSYGVEQGLSNQVVWDLIQDPEGYIWVGTEDGLFRYDGTRFTRFGRDEGLPGEVVPVLRVAADGTLWAGTNGGLAWWDGGRFQAIGRREGLPEGRVEGLACRRDGRVLTYLIHGGLFQGSRKEPFAPVPGHPLKGRGEGLWVDPLRDEILVISEGTLYRMAAPGRWTSIPLPIKNKVKARYSIHRDGTGRLWVFGPYAAFVQMGEDPEEEATFQDWSHRIPNLPPEPMAFLDAQGRIGLAGQTGVLLQDGPRAQEPVWRVIGAGQGLPMPWANVAFVDREGSLWVGGPGLHRIQGRMAWGRHTHREGLPSAPVWAVRRSQEGTLWAATEGGLAQSTPKGWVTVPITKGAAVQALAEDGAGSLYAGGSLRLGLLQRKRGVWRRIHFDPSVLTTRIMALAHVPGLGLLVGTWFDGLNVFDGKKLRPIPLPAGDRHESINSILVDPAGRVWVAASKGLALFEKGSWRRFEKSHGLKDTQTYSLALAPQGDVWVGYFGSHGLSRFRADAAGGRVVEHLDTSSGLLSANVSAVGYDAAGKFWVTTNQGAYRMDGRQVEHFGSGDGLPGSDFAGNSFWADPDGRVWMGTAIGLAEFRGDPPGDPPLPPVSVISKATYGSGLLLGRKEGSSTVPFRNRAVEFSFSALSFLNESNLRFQTRIVGLDSAWSDSEPRQARFPALPPGNYRFEVRSRLGGGDFGPVAACAFRIPAPWWLTWWGRWLLPGASGTFAAAWVAWGVFRFRLSRLRALNAVLIERNRIALDFHDGVGQGLAGLLLHLQAADNTLAGDTQTGTWVRAALRIAESTVAEVRGTLEAIRPSSIEEGRLADALSGMVDRIHPPVGVRIRFHPEPVRILPPTLCLHLYRIAEEALTNALKHADAERIDIHLWESGGWVRISVEDDGHGREDPEAPGSKFGPEKASVAASPEAPGGTQRPEGPGGPPRRTWGLRGMAERAKLLGAILVFEDRPGGGILVRVGVPVTLLARLSRIPTLWRHR